MTAAQRALEIGMALVQPAPELDFAVDQDEVEVVVDTSVLPPRPPAPPLHPTHKARMAYLKARHDEYKGPVYLKTEADFVYWAWCFGFDFTGAPRWGLTVYQAGMVIDLAQTVGAEISVGAMPRLKNLAQLETVGDKYSGRVTLSDMIPYLLKGRS